MKLLDPRSEYGRDRISNLLPIVIPRYYGLFDLNAIANRQPIDNVVGIVAVEIVRRSRNVDFDAATGDGGLECCLDVLLECIARSTAVRGSGTIELLVGLPVKANAPA